MGKYDKWLYRSRECSEVFKEKVILVVGNVKMIRYFT